MVDSLFAGGGEMGELMRSLDWSLTPIGAVESWPYSLRTLVSMMLNNNFGMLIFWGSDLVQMYNDAYRPILGSLKHPHAMGQCARDCWPEIWDVINPMFEQVLTTGKAVGSNDFLLYMNRNGFLEETHFIFSYSPLRDDEDSINGILVTVTEITEQILAERRAKILRDLNSPLAQVLLVEQICQISTEVLTNSREDVPFALIYLLESAQARLAGISGLVSGTDFAPAEIVLDGLLDICPWAEAMHSQTMQIVRNLDFLNGFATQKEWFYLESPHTALSLPLRNDSTQEIIGFLVIGTSPRLALDEKHQEFLELTAWKIGTYLRNANAYKIERDRAQALQESEERFRTLADNMAQFAWMADESGWIFWYNQRWFDYTGKTLAEMKGWGWQQVHHPEHVDRVTDKFRKYIEAGEIWEDTFPLRRKDSEYGWFLSRAIPIRNSQGKVMRWFGTNTDITDLRQAEIERDRSLQLEKTARAEVEFQRSRLDSILMQAPAFIAICNGRDFVFDFVNQLYSEISGNRQLIGLSVRQAFPEIEGQGFYELLDQVYTTGEKYIGEEMPIWLERNGDGTREKLLINFIYQPLYDRHNIIEGILIFGYEVTNQVIARQQAEALTEDLKAQQLALQKSEARFSRLVEANIIGVILVSADGTIREANDAFLHMVGYSREDLQHGVMNWHEMTPPEYFAQDQQVLNELINFGSSVPFEKEYIRKDGSYVPVLVGATPLSDGELAWVCFVLDLSESKKVEAVLREQAGELSRLNQVKDNFLATISHELRTPLTSMLGWATMLRSKKLDEATQDRALETIERNARAQNQLINDLLDVSSIITGKLRLNVRPLNIVSLIESAIDSIRPAAEAKNIRLQTILDPSAGAVSGDSDRLQQVFWNLLTNAIKFTPKGGRVQIRLARVDSHAEITVSDSGQGISAEFLPHVFERLQQADSKTTRVHGGLGLGLAIVRHLIELHGGTVYADSAGEGLGASFTIHLPIMILRSSSKPSEHIHPNFSDTISVIDKIRLENLKVLIVDDDLDSREMLAALLSENGAQVRTASSAKDGLNKIRQCNPAQLPDILISDIGMPEVDGYMFIRQVRALMPEQGGKIPAIALTAYARTEDRIKALSSGFQSHVPKPVESEEFVAVVASFMNRL